MDKAIRVRLEGDIAHFQRPFSMSTKQTYRVPPRSVVSGMLAGALGYSTNEYYEDFDPNRTNIGIEILNDVSVIDMGRNFRKTQKDQTTKPSSALPRGQYIKDFVEADHVQESIEYLRNPNYNLYIMSDDEELFDDLMDQLSNGMWHYQPYFGSSECFAELKEFEICDVEGIDTDEAEVCSVVPMPTVNRVYSEDIYTDRFVTNFETDEGGRVPTGYYDSYYKKDSEETINVDPTDSVYKVVIEGDHKDICFF
jgi:CRISPR-associated protein Cas5h